MKHGAAVQSRRASTPRNPTADATPNSVEPGHRRNELAHQLRAQTELDAAVLDRAAWVLLCTRPLDPYLGPLFAAHIAAW